MHNMYKIKNFFKQLKRVYDFLPIIWNSHDYDYQYAIELFSFQLNRMADFFESKQAVSYSAEKNARKIRTIVELLDRSCNDFYFEKHLEIMRSLYGDQTMEVVNNEDGSYKFSRIRWEKAVDDAHNTEINKVYAEMIRLASKKEDKAHELAWKLVAHNIRNFWD